MYLHAKSNHIFSISNFYAFRLFIDYRESNVQFMRRVPLFDPGIALLNGLKRKANNLLIVEKFLIMEKTPIIFYNEFYR